MHIKSIIMASIPLLVGCFTEGNSSKSSSSQGSQNGLSSLGLSSSGLSSSAISSSSVLTSQSLPFDSNVYRIGYLMGDGVADLEAMDWGRYTHIMLFSTLTPQEDGSIYRFKTYGNARITNAWVDGSNFKKSYYQKYKAQGGKVLLVVGGWGASITEGIATACKNDSSRANMIQQLSEIVYGKIVNPDGSVTQDLPLDGVDFDWEYPATVSDRQCFTKLLAETRAKMPDKLLTAAVYQMPSYYEAAKIGSILDWIGVMSYDDVVPNRYEHSSYGVAVRSAKKWHSAGVPWEKLVMGVAMYGYIGDGQKPWKDVYMDTSMYKYFTPVDSNQMKADFVVDSTMRGVMYWEITQDVYHVPESISGIIDDRFKSKGK